MTQDLLSQLRTLLTQWNQLHTELVTDANVDEERGLPRAAEAGLVGATAIKGCIDSLSAILSQ